MAKLARAQGMNTDIRRGVFNVLMSSEVSGFSRVRAGVLGQRTEPSAMIA